MSQHDPEADRLPGEHPDEISTAAYLDGELAGASRERLEAHLALCARCRAGMSMLALERAPGGTTPAAEDLARFREAALAGTPARNPWSRARVALLAAAALVLFSSGLALWLRDPDPSRSVFLERGGPSAGLAALAPARGAVLDCRALAFRFTPVQGADRYRITVTDEAGHLIATLESRGADAAAAWPDNRPAPRGQLLWSVRALALERVLDETRPVAFECR